VSARISRRQSLKERRAVFIVPLQLQLPHHEEQSVRLRSEAHVANAVSQVNQPEAGQRKFIKIQQVHDGVKGRNCRQNADLHLGRGHPGLYQGRGGVQETRVPVGKEADGIVVLESFLQSRGQPGPGKPPQVFELRAGPHDKVPGPAFQAMREDRAAFFQGGKGFKRYLFRLKTVGTDDEFFFFHDFYLTKIAAYSRR